MILVVIMNTKKLLKNYIDDLVFALYFNISVKIAGINEADRIKELCSKNEFYEYMNKKK